MRWTHALPLILACTPTPMGSSDTANTSSTQGESESSDGSTSTGPATMNLTSTEPTRTSAQTSTSEGSTRGTTGIDETTGTSGSTGEDACPLPSGVNAMISAQDNRDNDENNSGVLLPLYGVSDQEHQAVAYRRQGEEVEALSAAGEPLWSATLGPGALLGGFELDGDGWPDLAVARHDLTGPPCGAQTKGTSWLSFFHGVDGAHAADTTAQSDICWTFGDVTYPTTQWTAGGVLFGPLSQAMMLTPTYAATSSLVTWSSQTQSFDAHSLYYPSTAQYDSAYTADELNHWNTGTSFVANSHIGNGLIIGEAGQERAVFFTSGRALQYAVAPLSPGQLIDDAPYISAGRTDMAGRNYGLVAQDPGAPERVVLIAGTNASTVYADMIAGELASDPWGQIERHVSIYDTAAQTITDRFYSYAHDAGDGHKYQGRVVYPDSPFVRRGPGTPSRLAYNVYSEGHWFLHISDPNSLADVLAIRGVFLWDIRDLDGDGVDEWIVSPVELPEDPDVPGYYFPKWTTDLYRWDEQALALDKVHAYAQGVPELVAAFRQPDRSTSMSYLYPVPVVAVECEPRLVLRSPQGERSLVALP